MAGEGLRGDIPNEAPLNGSEVDIDGVPPIDEDAILVDALKKNPRTPEGTVMGPYVQDTIGALATDPQLAYVVDDFRRTELRDTNLILGPESGIEETTN